MNQRKMLLYHQWVWKLPVVSLCKRIHKGMTVTTWHRMRRTSCPTPSSTQVGVTRRTPCPTPSSTQVGVMRRTPCPTPSSTQVGVIRRTPCPAPSSTQVGVIRRAAVSGVAQSWTWPKRLSSSSSSWKGLDDLNLSVTLLLFPCALYGLCLSGACTEPTDPWGAILNQIATIMISVMKLRGKHPKGFPFPLLTQESPVSKHRKQQKSTERRWRTHSEPLRWAWEGKKGNTIAIEQNNQPSLKISPPNLTCICWSISISIPSPHPTPLFFWSHTKRESIYHPCFSKQSKPCTKNRLFRICLLQTWPSQMNPVFSRPWTKIS